VVASLQNGPVSTATDDSYQSDSKLYPIVVTFHNSKTNQIESCLLSVPVLEGDATGNNIGNLLLDNLKSNNIPLSNCLAPSADNAPVMIGQENGIAGMLKSEIENLYVIACPCHLINLAVEKGAACLPDKADEYLVDIFFYLERSAKTKDMLKQFQQLHNTEIRKIL
jgi:hypothetical protein